MTEDSAIDETQGIVVEDLKENQFVWIPVKKASDFTQNLSSYPYNYSNRGVTYTDTAGGYGYPDGRLYC